MSLSSPPKVQHTTGATETHTEFGAYVLSPLFAFGPVFCEDHYFDATLEKVAVYAGSAPAQDADFDKRSTTGERKKQSCERSLSQFASCSRLLSFDGRWSNIFSTFNFYPETGLAKRVEVQIYFQIKPFIHTRVIGVEVTS